MKIIPIIIIFLFSLPALAASDEDKKNCHSTNPDDLVLKHCTVLANEGNATAMYYLGHMHLDPKSDYKDYEKAITWLEKSASAGNAGALHYLGLQYEHHPEIKNEEKSAEYLLRSAKEGNMLSVHYLANKLLAAGETEAGIKFLKIGAEYGYQPSIDALAKHGAALNKASNPTP